VTPTAESVSAPYSNPMFDVQAVSRFYRCSISDVHIGRSLERIKCPVLTAFRTLHSQIHSLITLHETIETSETSDVI